MTTKTATIQRINFLQQERFVLTYRRMLMIGAGVVGLCVLMSGLQILRTAYADRQLARLDVEVKQLREERDRISKQISSRQGEMSARDFLANLFDRGPRWTAVLKELAAVMPRSLWLTGVKSTERSDPSAPLTLQLSGKAEEAASVARFLKALNASSFFKDVVLNSSQLVPQGGGTAYIFAIGLMVAPGEGKRL